MELLLLTEAFANNSKNSTKYNYFCSKVTMATNKTENPVAYPVPNAAPGGPYAGYSYTGTSGGTYAAPPAATYTATPVNAYPSVVAVGNPNQNFSQVQQQTPSGPPRGHWRDGLCDCFSNLWPSCGCNFIFHGAWLAAQSK